MTIEYTDNLGLPRIDLDHDATESEAAMKAMSTTLDAFPGKILVYEGDILTFDGEILYFGTV